MTETLRCLSNRIEYIENRISSLSHEKNDYKQDELEDAPLMRDALVPHPRNLQSFGKRNETLTWEDMFEAEKKIPTLFIFALNLKGS